MKKGVRERVLQAIREGHNTQQAMELYVFGVRNRETFRQVEAVVKELREEGVVRREKEHRVWVVVR